MNTLEKKYLFAPGPVLTDKRVKEAALAPDICHRRADFENIYAGLRQKLVRLYRGTKANYTTVVVSGSGTASNETVLSSVLREGEKVLLITNGEFGERLRKIVECYRLGINLLAFEWGETPSLSQVEEQLRNDKDISLVSMVFHETSTGMINPVHEVGVLAKKYGKLYHVDAISAIGGEDVNVLRDHIDFCTGVPNKSVGGLPGVSFICVRNEAYNKVKQVEPRRNIYLNLQHHMAEANRHNQTPNTPSVVMFITLDKALDVLFEEGQDMVIERYKECAGIIRKGVKDLGLNLLIENEQLMSNTVTSVFLPKQHSLSSFMDKLEERGYVVYLGKGKFLDMNMFQIANMGQIYPDDSKLFIKVLADVL